jgi:AcrR family transcriptional regulator
LLNDQGLSALQMREVAQRAGIALGTVYSYFPTKEALFSAMYAERLDEFLGEIESVLAQTQDLEQVFVSVALAYRHMYAEFGSELDVLSDTGRGDDSESAVGAELVQSAAAIWLAMREVVQRAGVKDPDLSLTLLWSSVTGLANQFTGARHELHRFSYEEAVRYAMRVLVRALQLEHDTE